MGDCGQLITTRGMKEPLILFDAETWQHRTVTAALR